MDAASGVVPRFYVGTHHPHWLWAADFPVFVSHRRLSGRTLRNLRPARVAWALDSGGFTELAMHGRWCTTAVAYADAVQAYMTRLGRPDFVAPQDWMCEPFMVGRTGLSVREHQERTVANYLRLRELAPSVPFAPVLQGWRLADYVRCIELYRSAAVDLAACPVVGLGSVCRRQSTAEIAVIVTTLAELGLRLHGFGVKTGGLIRYGRHLISADSMAWSFRARRSPALPGCITHRNCANCLHYARRWYRDISAQLAATCTQPHQLTLFPRPTLGAA